MALVEAESSMSGHSLGSRGISAAYRVGRRTSGLGKPITGDDNYIVRVFYGGYYCEESLEGPFATMTEAATVWREHHDKGHGAIIYQCSNVTASLLEEQP